ncbi:MAG: hypothetical protein KGK08_11100, partial [Acidobacteriota bacterium]|nr:hypothetical protein [Acidobacteriota bacterium]
MVNHPFKNLSRLALAACVVGLGAASVVAQSAPSTAAPAINPSRVDIFGGYSYFGAHGTLQPLGANYSSIDKGLILSGAYYFNKYAGLESIYVGHFNGNNDALSTISGGVIFRAPMDHYTLFAHGLVGGGRLDGPNSASPQYQNPYKWGPALTAGGGMDYDLPFLQHRLSLRLFEADYRFVHADFGPYTAPPTTGTMGGRANLNGVDLSTGLVAHIGTILPPPPVTYACSVAPATVYPGDPITVTGTAANLNPK